jgi:hypothetical protein
MSSPRGQKCPLPLKEEQAKEEQEDSETKQTAKQQQSADAGHAAAEGQLPLTEKAIATLRSAGVWESLIVTEAPSRPALCLVAAAWCAETGKPGAVLATIIRNPHDFKRIDGRDKGEPEPSETDPYEVWQPPSGSAWHQRRRDEQIRKEIAKRDQEVKEKLAEAEAFIERNEQQLQAQKLQVWEEVEPHERLEIETEIRSRYVFAKPGSPAFITLCLNALSDREERKGKAAWDARTATGDRRSKTKFSPRPSRGFANSCSAIEGRSNTTAAAGRGPRHSTRRRRRVIRSLAARPRPRRRANLGGQWRRLPPQPKNANSGSA